MCPDVSIHIRSSMFRVGRWTKLLVCGPQELYTWKQAKHIAVGKVMVPFIKKWSLFSRTCHLPCVKQDLLITSVPAILLLSNV